MTIPREIKADPDNIEIGKDGLICEMGTNSGLLLPQVATEWNWDAKEFLNHTCEKAGLPNNSWKTGKCKFLY